MSKKSAKIAALIQTCKGGKYDPHYLGYFECFNRQLFYEAHDVLEEIWLLQRKQPNDLFYKGLIQLAGAFVHLQKNRLGPAAALFKLARKNMELYPAAHEGISVGEIKALINCWLQRLEQHGENPLLSFSAPCLPSPGSESAPSLIESPEADKTGASR